ncbi:MAG: TetR/AcrR family transcriptional regulator [Bacteroidota bacterium]
MPRALEFDEEEILKKAMILFWQKGYHDTSIKDLIDFLGISNASIYNTFGGKKQLFERAFALYRNSNYEGLKQFLNTQRDVRQGLKRVFHKIITDDSNDPDCKGCFIVNTTAELVPHDLSIQKAVEQNKLKNEKLFFDFLQKGADAGQIAASKDLNMIAHLLYTFMMGLRVVGKTKPDQAELMASVEGILAILD